MFLYFQKSGGSDHPAARQKTRAEEGLRSLGLRIQGQEDLHRHAFLLKTSAGHSPHRLHHPRHKHHSIRYTTYHKSEGRRYRKILKNIPQATLVVSVGFG